MNKKFLPLLMLGALISLTACGGGTSSTTTSNSGSEGLTKMVIDLQGRNVYYKDSDVERVICLGAGALRMYSYVGDLSKLVGIEKIDNTPFGVGTALRPYYLANKNVFSTIPVVTDGGPGEKVPNYEGLISARPGIIVSFYSSKDLNNEISQKVGVPVIALSNGSDGVFDDKTEDSLELLGTVFHKESRAQELINYIDAVEDEFDNLSESTSTAYAGCIGNWGKTNLYGSYYGFPVFEQAEVTNAIDSLEWPSGAKQVTVDAEKLAQINPDKIFFDDAGFSGFLSDYKTNPEKYETLKAFQNGELYSLLPYNAYYTNLEIQLMSTCYVASVFHNEFKNLDIAAKCNEISTKFLGKALYNDMCENATTFKGGYAKIELANY